MLLAGVLHGAQGLAGAFSCGPPALRGVSFIAGADWRDEDHVENLLNPKNKRWAQEMFNNVRLSSCVAGHCNLVVSEEDLQVFHAPLPAAHGARSAIPDDPVPREGLWLKPHPSAGHSGSHLRKAGLPPAKAIPQGRGTAMG